MRTRLPRLLLILPVTVPVLFAQQDRIAGAINSRDTVVLKGNSSPQARPEFDRGPVDATLHLYGITVNFKPTAMQRAALQELLKQQQDRASAGYHKWLQPGEFADRFGLSPGDFAKAVAWAQAQGFGVEYQAHTRTWMRLSGAAEQIERAFHTELHRYEVDGAMHFANLGDPSVPAALEPLISAIRGLDDFYPKPPHRIARPSPEFNNGTNGTHDLVPGDLWTIYDVNPLLAAGYNGSFQKLVVVGQSNVNLSDVSSFRSTLQLPLNNPQIVFAGGTDPGTVASQSGEIDLDLEWAGGMAPNAAISYVYAEDSFLATQYAIDNNLAPVISSSYTTCEAQVNASLAGAAAYFEGLAQQANALGITWVVSSGDQGAAACEASGAGSAINGLAVNMPASIPEVTGVGGTTFNDAAGGYWNGTNAANSSSALKYIPEVAWNDTLAVGHLSASGGGASSLYQKPSWQTGLGVPNDGARDVPDVAFAASEQHIPYAVIEGGTVVFVGGTSVAAPVFAGMLTLLNQYLVANKLQAGPGLGNVNPALYHLAHSSTTAFHDITSGGNVVPCEISTPNCANGNLGYNAGPGYDEVTGLGSIDLANLASQWGAPAGAALTFTAAPATVNQNPSDSTCPFAQYLTLQESNGYGVDLTRFLGGSTDYTSSILSVFGSLRVPPLGSLSGAACWTVTPPVSATLEMDGTDTLGNAVVAKTAVAFQSSAQNGGTLAVSPVPLQLSVASASQSVTGTITLTVGPAQQWTVTAAPDGQASAWLAISPHAGTGPAQITVTATGAGLSDGAYSAILVFQSQNTSPQYVGTGIIFTVGASSTVKIAAVGNAASGQQVGAPGMYLSIYGSDLAPPGTNLLASTSPLPLTLAGVSATVNGIPAAMEYAGPGQVNILMPFETPAGQAVLGLNNNGQAASYVFPVLLALPGIFVDPANGLLAGTENASRGAEIAFYITGQGDVSPAIASNTVPPVPAPKPLLPVSVTIGGAPATVVYDALASPYEGETQINVIVPASISTGQQKVVVTVGGVASVAALLNVTN